MPGSSSILGTDVGGTFTDFVLITGGGELHCGEVVEALLGLLWKLQ